MPNRVGEVPRWVTDYMKGTGGDVRTATRPGQVTYSITPDDLRKATVGERRRTVAHPELRLRALELAVQAFGDSASVTTAEAFYQWLTATTTGDRK